MSAQGRPRGPAVKRAATARGRAKPSAKRKTTAPPARKPYWSGTVTRESRALDLEQGVFTWSDPKRIAKSLSRSAEVSRNRKAQPFRSAMSMLVFYINRAGPKLAEAQRHVLERAKDALREIYGKER